MRRMTREELVAVRGGKALGTACGLAVGVLAGTWHFFGAVPVFGSSYVIIAGLVAGTTCALDAIF